MHHLTLVVYMLLEEEDVYKHIKSNKTGPILFKSKILRFNLLQYTASIWVCLLFTRVTTGQRSFAEGLHICRESNIGRSAKNPLPRASAWQSLALGKSSFVESSTLGTNRTSAKPQLCKRPTYAVIFAESQLLGSRQNIFLYREPQPRLSAKKNSDFCSHFFCGALLQ
jgi:hypothetical protein